MSLARDGFFSSDVEASAAEALRHFAPKVVEFTLRVNRVAIAVARVPRDLQQRDADLFAAALLARVIQDFEGAVILAARGLRAQSRALARSTFESALYCAAASRDLVLAKGATRKPKKDVTPTTRFVEAIEGGHQRFRAHVATALQAMPDLPTEQVATLRRLLDEVGTPSQHQDIDLRGLADDLGLDQLFTIVYRPLSQDAHPSATSLEHHLELTAEGKIAGLRIGPDFTQFADTLMLAVCSILLALDAYLDRFGTTAEKQEMQALAAAYRELNEGSSEVPGSH